MLSSLLEIGLSVGGYYLLRALHVSVLGALVGPAVAVAVVAVALTVRRRRVDPVGALVLAELAVTITLSLLTRSPRVAAVREPAYVLAGGLFCLLTLTRPRPLTERTTARLASFGDPERTAAFEYAWCHVPAYRRWQRALTTVIGVLMAGASAIRVHRVLTAPAAGLPHAVDVSNTVGLVMLVAVGVAAGVLIQPPRRIIERILAGEASGPVRRRHPSR